MRRENSSLLVAIGILAIVAPCCALRRSKRETNMCDTQTTPIKDAVDNKPDFHTKYTFTNDSNTGLMMTWGGLNSQYIILVTTRTEDLLFYKLNYASHVYRSDDAGASFVEITSTFGPSVVVRSDNGLQNNPLDQNHILLLLIQNSKLVIWVSINGGLNWIPNVGKLDFQLTASDTPLKFNMRAASLPATQANAAISKRWLITRATDSNLYASLDGGLTWTKVASNVIDAVWATSIDPLSAVYALNYDGDSGVIGSSGYKPKYGCCTLRKYDLTDSEGGHAVLTNVYSFGVFENYLFASVWDSSAAGRAANRRSLKVSADGGTTFQTVQLPTATPDTFYSILTVDSLQAFIHVDESGDTGRGALYISDANGTLYSESLHNHFYPDYFPVSDFYHIKSMRGTYLTTAINSDLSMYSVITFDRGAEWKRISKPTNVDCDSSTPASECGLQITSVYALSNTHAPVTGSLPLSSETAPGIVLAHGHVSNTMQADDPDVYLSDDGGYSWRRVLNGPHYYQIAHFGALLVAAPIAGTTKPTDSPNVLHFSLDSGACWHEIIFESDEFTVTGIVTAPGNRNLSVALWGFTSQKKWRVHVVNFDELLTVPCSDSDYETWIPHASIPPQTASEGCLLGSRDTYKRLRKDSWCAADYNTTLIVKSEPCLCTYDDYDCAYGFYRPMTQSEECVKHPNISILEVCLNGDLQEVVSDGYNKIPGDTCVGGFTPHYLDEQLQVIKDTCDDADKLQRALTVDDDGHVMGSDIVKQLKTARDQDLAKVQQFISNRSQSIYIVILVIGSVALSCGLILIIIKVRRLRSRSRRSFRYGRLANEVDDQARSRLIPPSTAYVPFSANNDDDDPMVNIAAPNSSAAPADDVLVNPRD